MDFKIKKYEDICITSVPLNFLLKWSYWFPKNCTCTWWIICVFSRQYFFQACCKEFFIAFQKTREYIICSLFKLGFSNIFIFFTFLNYFSYQSYGQCVNLLKHFWVIAKPIGHKFCRNHECGTEEFFCSFFRTSFYQQPNNTMLKNSILLL